MSNTEAGWLGCIFSFGNLLGIPVLVTLTDRFDARRIWLGSMLLMGLAHLGFALLAAGLWRGMLFRGLSGIGFAGTYIQIGRAHVCTPVTNAHLVCRLLLEKKTRQTTSHHNNKPHTH